MTHRNPIQYLLLASPLLIGMAFFLWAGQPTATTAVLAQGAGWPEIEVVDSGLRGNAPMYVTSAGDGSNRIFVVEREGIVSVVKDGVAQTRPFLDISDRVDTDFECGFHSIAFPNDYASKGYFFVYYNHKVEQKGPNEITCDTIIERFWITANPDVADNSTSERILVVDQPRKNHNGGQIAFGPDEYLYIALGDGGGSPGGRPQAEDNILGKMLRIEVGSTGTYTTPPTNPFTQTVGYLPEIWSLGFRNPWRFSFDRQTGDIYIGDVGQSSYEEIDFQPASSNGGENYGWSIMEGMHCYRASTCDMTGLTMPVVEYGRTDGQSVTGGFVYRGTKYPQLQGIYFYGDYSTGRIWGLRRNGDGWESQELLDTSILISTFGEDEDGNLYVADIRGTIYEIADKEAPPVPTPEPTATSTATPQTTATETTTETTTPQSTATETTTPQSTATGGTMTMPPTATPKPPADTDIVFNEIFYHGDNGQDWIEFKNNGTDTFDMSNWWLCARFDYKAIKDLSPVGAASLAADALVLKPGEVLVLEAWTDLTTASDLGLYRTDDFGEADAMIDFVQWGTSESVGRANVAVEKGIWSETAPGVYDFVPTAPDGQSLAWRGSNGSNSLYTLSSDFVNDTPSQGQENPVGSQPRFPFYMPFVGNE